MQRISIVTSEAASTSLKTLSAEAPFLQDEDGQLNYIDPGHWQSILEDIKEVREHLTGSLPNRIGPSLNDGAQADASFLFGEESRASLAETDVSTTTIQM